MSYAFAGAMKGLGGSIMKLADERRKLAEDLLKMETKADLDKDVAESRAASSARHRKGSRGGGSGGKKSGRALSNQERDDLNRLYESYSESGAFEGRAPTLGEFQSYVERVLPDAGSLSQAAEIARQSWGSEEVTKTELKERHALSPARIWDDDGKYEETTTDTRYGFKAALGADPEPEPASVAAAPPRGAAAASPAPTNSGPDPAEALQEAKAAIQRGADPEKVKARLREMGIEPKGL